MFSKAVTYFDQNFTSTVMVSGGGQTMLALTAAISRKVKSESCAWWCRSHTTDPVHPLRLSYYCRTRS